MTNARWGAVGGFAFAGLFVAAVLVSGEQLGSIGDSDRQFISYFGETSNRVRDIVAAYVLVAAALAFIVFLGHLCGATLESSRGRALPLIALGTGLVFAALLVAAAAALSAVHTSLTYAAMFGEDDHEFSADTMRLATQAAFMLLVFAMWAAAACIVAISLAGRRAGLFPGWLFWAGMVASLALLFGFFFMPVVALPVWVLAFCIWLFISPAQVTSRS